MKDGDTINREWVVSISKMFPCIIQIGKFCNTFEGIEFCYREGHYKTIQQAQDECYKLNADALIAHKDKENG